MKVTRRPSSIFAAWLSALLYIALAAPALAQDTQAQIEADVWIPFLAASNAFDADGFLAVQSKDMVRVSPDANEVYGLARYEREIREGFARAKTRGLTRKSEMRFLKRTSSEGLAYETGYFRSEARLASGEVRVRFSRFEMVLKKEEGKWKILIDKDSAEGGSITEEAFRAAEPMRRGTPDM